MKRTALHRKTPLRRSKPMRQRSSKRRPTSLEDHAYMAWVHTLDCCAPDHVCAGRIEAHHAGKKPGLRLKAPDDTVIPLCTQAHRDIDAHAGPFRGWTGAELREWQDYQIIVFQAMWEVFGKTNPDRFAQP